MALSSDAHRPEDVGADYEQALELLAELGVSELCVFERRERRLERIEPHPPGAAPASGAAREREERHVSALDEGGAR